MQLNNDASERAEPDSGMARVAWCGREIVVKQGGGGVVGTGAVVSGSAETFLDFLQRRSVAGGNVLELGSGTGVVAIGLAACGCSVVATDARTNPHGCSTQALRNAALDTRPAKTRHATGSFSDLLQVIRHNAELNDDILRRAGGCLEVLPLLWRDRSQLASVLQHQGEKGFDFIVGCNVTYQPASYPDLMHVLSAASFPRTKIFLANTDCLGDNQELARVAKEYNITVEKVLHNDDTFTEILELTIVY